MRVPTVAVDAMGGYGAPDAVVRGVAAASLRSDIDCILVGDEGRIQAVLQQVPHNPERLAVHHCRDAIGMEEDARAAVRAKRDASVLAGAALVAEGRAEVVVSAGNPGASVLACARHFRLYPALRRAALAAVYPRRTEYMGQDEFALLLDVGAAPRCEARDLVQFALMGSAYARAISGVPVPRVGVVAGVGRAGREDPVAAAAEELATLPDLNFVGTIGGAELAGGKADVVVCEGQVGAVVLGLVCGIGRAFVDVAGLAARERLSWRLVLPWLRGAVRRMPGLTDYPRYAGAPLLGYEQVLIACHPRSGPATVHNAVKLAAKTVRAGVAAAAGAAAAAAVRESRPGA